MTHFELESDQVQIKDIERNEDGVPVKLITTEGVVYEISLRLELARLMIGRALPGEIIRISLDPVTNVIIDCSHALTREEIERNLKELKDIR